MPLPQVKTTEDEALHREMERVSLDWVMIQNPTDEDFYIDWLPWHYLVPNKNKDIGWGNGKLETQRYLAVWYCKHMKDKMINDMGQKEYDKMIQERADKGQAALTKFEEQKAIWEKLPQSNNDKELAKIYPMLFLGVTREFGMDYQPQQVAMVNQKTAEELTLEKMQNKRYNPEEKPHKPTVTMTPPPVVPSVEALEELITGDKEGLAQEVTA
jgi:hypothetical protein